MKTRRAGPRAACRQRLPRPYMPVSVALPIALAFTMNPTSDAFASAGVDPRAVWPSPVRGRAGNVEFTLWAGRGTGGPPSEGTTLFDVEAAIVAASRDGDDASGRASEARRTGGDRAGDGAEDRAGGRAGGRDG